MTDTTVRSSTRVTGFDDPELDFQLLRQLGSACYGGASVGRPTVLLQPDLLDTETDVDGDGAADDDVQAWAVYGEANYLWRDWMNTKVAFDIYDPSDNEGEDTMTRISFGIEPFIDRFLQLRLFYRIFNGPENEPATNRDELTLEAHLFF